MRICLCASQVPFAYGGAEMLVQSLRDELLARGFEVEVVALPYAWADRLQLLKSGLAWRLLDLREAAGKKIDRVIATRFPSYFVRHPHKVVWLIHQMRQVYDLQGTRYSDFTNQPRDQKVVEMVRAMDTKTLSEARAVYTISKNTADRLRRWNGLAAEVLYPPPRLAARCRPGESGDYVLAVGRLDELKRFDLLLRAMAETRTPVRCRIAGSGPELEALRSLAARLGVADRVEIPGWVDDERLIELYSGCLAVFYAPYDEDYGYVTVEAFKCGKPVLTAADSGGVLEFVADGGNGFVVPPGDPGALAARIDLLYRDRERARALGAAGAAAVAGIDWDRVIAKLTG
ncbi:MAG TPA: glycosyltransferase family 4 protein [Thermoanaerobaculia bacterium]|nr:glycosyltransferase family 4 protein [Thermoanaerobaculia bacterium]